MTLQSAFVNDRGLKIDSKTYKKHLKKELLPGIESIMKRNDWMFIQDCHITALSSGSNLA